MICPRTAHWCHGCSLDKNVGPMEQTLFSNTCKMPLFVISRPGDGDSDCLKLRYFFLTCMSQEKEL